MRGCSEASGTRGGRALEAVAVAVAAPVVAVVSGGGSGGDFAVAVGGVGGDGVVGSPQVETGTHSDFW